MPKPPLTDSLEALLFLSPEPITASKLSKITGESLPAVQTALDNLGQKLTGGIRLANTGASYQLVTAPSVASVVEQYESDTSKQDLTKAALETLSIVAYRGPITKSDIEAIRGVASETMLRSLISRGLVSEAGRSDAPGKPIQFIVSHLFLQHFGLTSTKDLPPLPSESEVAT